MTDCSNIKMTDFPLRDGNYQIFAKPNSRLAHELVVLWCFIFGRLQIIRLLGVDMGVSQQHPK